MDQVTDIVVRLRDRSYSSKAPDPLVEEAATEIERLRRIVSMWEQCATMTRDMYGGCYRPAYAEKLEQTAKTLLAAAKAGKETFQEAWGKLAESLPTK